MTVTGTGPRGAGVAVGGAGVGDTPALGELAMVIVGDAARADDGGGVEVEGAAAVAELA